MEQVSAQHGVGQLPEIKSWGLSNAYDRWPEQALPALVVVAEGIGRDGTPEQYAGGFYRASWALGVSVTIEHPRADDARKLAHLFAAAVRGALLQRRGLGSGGRVTKWLDEGYPMSIKERRTRASAENVFAVAQDEVVNWRLGPKTPEPPTSPIEYPEVTETDADVEVKE